MKRTKVPAVEPRPCQFCARPIVFAPKLQRVDNGVVRRHHQATEPLNTDGTRHWCTKQPRRVRDSEVSWELWTPYIEALYR